MLRATPRCCSSTRPRHASRYLPVMRVGPVDEQHVDLVEAEARSGLEARRDRARGVVVTAGNLGLDRELLARRARLAQEVADRLAHRALVLVVDGGVDQSVAGIESRSGWRGSRPHPRGGRCQSRSRGWCGRRSGSGWGCSCPQATTPRECGRSGSPFRGYVGHGAHDGHRARSRSKEARMSRITVIGGTGYAGAAIVAEAVKRGHEVLAIARNAPERTRRRSDLPSGLGLRR